MLVAALWRLGRLLLVLEMLLARSGEPLGLQGVESHAARGKGLRCSHSRRHRGEGVALGRVSQRDMPGIAARSMIEFVGLEALET
jgi:hypothetical protein